MSKHYVQYISGIDRQPVAKPINVSIERDGLKVFKQLIRWEDMTSVTTSTNAAGNGFSVGGAIVGDALAGGVGALVGGMAGGSKFDTFVHIAHTSGGTMSDLVLLPKGAPKAKIKFINTLIDKHGKAPLTFQEQKQAMREQHQQRRADMDAKWTERREQLAAARLARKERNERQRTWLKNLFGRRRK